MSSERLKRRVWFVLNGFVVVAAAVWRRLLFRTTFIGITGSVGKTTAKELAYAVLSSKFQGVKTRDNKAARRELPRTILRARPWHRFVVAEVGINQTGIMWRSAKLLKPDIAVFLGVKENHLQSFGDPDVTAEEKAQLLWGMSRRGTAVLNSDDARVSRIAERLERPIVWFGAEGRSSQRIQCWSEDVSAPWPERLSFTAHWGEEAVQVRTQLVGEHWTPSAIAAVAVGRLMGIPLAEMAAPLSAEPPFRSRMEPVKLPSGAILIRDHYNGSISSLGPALRAIDDHAGGRRILMISDVADVPGNYRHRLRRVAEVAAGACDVLVFVGQKAAYGRRRALESGFDEDRVFAFKYPFEATAFLEEETGGGDVVLLRGKQSDRMGQVLEGVDVQPLPAPASAVVNGGRG